MRDDNPCLIDGCNSTRVWNSPLCHTHYLPRYARGSLDQRFWSRVEVGVDCWLFTGQAKGRCSGYPSFRVGKRVEYAHRLAYSLAYGDLTPDLVIDHICHDVRCVNPAHLRQVTRGQNAQHLRGAYKSSKSGIRGVVQRGNCWVASVQHNGKIVFRQQFRTVEEAEAAAIRARNEIFTHNEVDRTF